MDSVSVSVIIPVYNGERHLHGQLEALARQEYGEPWEVVIVDNGSTDRSIEVARSFRGRLPRLHILCESSSGKAHAVNRGVRAATGRFLLFLDQDDEVAPGYLTAMTSALEEYDVVGARVDRDSLNPPWARYQGGQTDSLCVRRGCPEFSIGGALGARAETLREVEFSPDVGASDDIDFCWRAQAMGFRLGFVPSAILRYRQRSEEASALRQGFYYGRSEVLIYRRYRHVGHPRPSLRVVLWTVKSLLLLVPRSADRGHRMRLMYWSGIFAGNIYGSVRCRVLYI